MMMTQQSYVSFITCLAYMLVSVIGAINVHGASGLPWPADGLYVKTSASRSPTFRLSKTRSSDDVDVPSWIDGVKVGPEADERVTGRICLWQDALALQDTPDGPFDWTDDKKHLLSPADSVTKQLRHAGGLPDFRFPIRDVTSSPSVSSILQDEAQLLLRGDFPRTVSNLQYGFMEKKRGELEVKRSGGSETKRSRSLWFRVVSLCRNDTLCGCDNTYHAANCTSVTECSKVPPSHCGTPLNVFRLASRCFVMKKAFMVQGDMRPIPFDYNITTIYSQGTETTQAHNVTFAFAHEHLQTRLQEIISGPFDRFTVRTRRRQCPN